MIRLTTVFAAAASLGLLASVSVIAAPAVGAADASVITTIGVGAAAGPNFISMSPDGTRAYVSNVQGDSVSVIDTGTNTVTATIGLPLNSEPNGMAVLPTGERAYLTLAQDNQVAVLDLTTNQPLGFINVGIGPVSASVTPDGSRVYVSNYGGGFGTTVSVIDTATDTVTGLIPVGQGPGIGAVTPDGSEFYLPNVTSDSISIINTATNAVVVTIVDPGKIDTPEMLAISPDGTRAYVPIALTNSVAVIDTTIRAVVAEIPFPSRPISVSVSPDGRRLYVSLPGVFPGNLMVYDLQTDSIVGAPIVVQDGPLLSAVTPNSTRVYLVNRLSDSVSVIDTGLRTVSFNANGGQGAMVNQREYSPQALRPLAFDRPGYLFTGWNTSPNGSGASYPNQGQFPFNFDTTLYAQWAIPEPPVPLPAIPPFAPRNLTATAGDGSAAVTWMEPASPGTFPIDSYVVTSSPPGGACQTDGTVRSCAITGLVNGVTYTFTATATSLAGPSLASAPSNAVTPQASTSIRISGARITIDSKPAILVSGTTAGLPAGTALRPWIRFPRKADYRAEETTVRIDELGNFTWQRITAKKVHVVFRTEEGGLESNRVTIRR